MSKFHLLGTVVNIPPCNVSLFLEHNLDETSEFYLSLLNSPVAQVFYFHQRYSKLLAQEAALLHLQ